ncbi:MAG TPA: hypothetical protein VN084_04445 [Methylophilaceae bacterium]|nr:hypothetical protein [Methylophilaceae bacterium]
MVYEKSYSGHQELINNQRALNARQRQVLIMIDGKRTQDDLARYLQNLDVPEIIADLERQGYIHTPGKPGNSVKAPHHASGFGQAKLPPAAPTGVAQPQPNASSPAPIPASNDAGSASAQERPLDSGTLAAVKVILSISAKEHLGLMGRPMIEKIEKIQDRAQLLTAISQWHMAIRESKSGRTTASVLIEEVNQLLNK